MSTLLSALNSTWDVNLHGLQIRGMTLSSDASSLQSFYSLDTGFVQMEKLNKMLNGVNNEMELRVEV